MVVIVTEPLWTWGRIPDELKHPEVAVTHAKLGCDVLFSCAGHIDPSWQIVAAAKTLERITIVVAGHNMDLSVGPRSPMTAGSKPWSPPPGCAGRCLIQGKPGPRNSRTGWTL